jgi:hypothetical protein
MILQLMAFVFICIKSIVICINGPPAQPPFDILIELAFWIITFLYLQQDRDRLYTTIQINVELANENANLEIYKQQHHEMSEAISWFMRRLQWVSELRK